MRILLIFGKSTADFLRSTRLFDKESDNWTITYNYDPKAYSQKKLITVFLCRINPRIASLTLRVQCRRELLTSLGPLGYWVMGCRVSIHSKPKGIQKLQEVSQLLSGSKREEEKNGVSDTVQMMNTMQKPNCCSREGKRKRKETNWLLDKERKQGKTKPYPFKGFSFAV